MTEQGRPDDWVGRFMAMHVDRMAAELSPEVTSRPTWGMLTAPEVVDFVTNLAPPPSKEPAVHTETRPFGRLFVAASRIPTMNMRRFRKKLLSDGYLTMLEPIKHTSGFSAGTADLAHWMVFDDGKGSYGVNLSYLPAAREAKPLLPLELLSSKEKRQVGLIIR